MARISSPLITGLIVAYGVSDPAGLVLIAWDIFLLAAILTSAVGVHEFCHLLAAKALGLRVDEFGLAFGPELIGHNAKGIRWRINLIPVGGYVKLHGETTSEGEGSFVDAPAWKKLLVLVAGPLSNFAFAFLILFALGTWLFFTADQAAGARSGFWADPTLLLRWDWNVAYTIVGVIVSTTVNAVGAYLPHATSSPTDLPFAGIPTMATSSSQFFSMGPIMFTLFAAAINLSLGFMNLLPIPPLDGGQAFIATLRGIMGRFYPARLMQAVTVVGVMLVIGFMLYVNGIDIINHITGHLPSVYSGQ
jgi:regulator of sigma E protease